MGSIGSTNINGQENIGRSSKSFRPNLERPPVHLHSYLKSIFKVIFLFTSFKFIISNNKNSLDGQHRRLDDSSSVLPIIAFDISRNGTDYLIQGDPCSEYSMRLFHNCPEQLKEVEHLCETFLTQIPDYNETKINKYDPDVLGQDPSIKSTANELQKLPGCLKHSSDEWPEFLDGISNAVPVDVDDYNEPDAEAVPIPDGGEGATNTTAVNGTSIAVGSGANSTNTGSNSTTSVPIGVPVSGPGNGTNSNTTAINSTSIEVGSGANSTNTGSNSTTFVPTGLPVPSPGNNGTVSNNSTVVNGTDDSGNSGIMINSNNPVTFTPTGLPTQMPVAVIVPVSYQNGTYHFQGNPCDKYEEREFSSCEEKLSEVQKTCNQFLKTSGITIPGNSDPIELQKNSTINDAANDLQEKQVANCLTYKQENGDKWQDFLSIVATILSSLPTSQPSGFPTGQPSSKPSRNPSGQPTVQPSPESTGQPTSSPSGFPTGQPSRNPSGQPTGRPTKGIVTAFSALFQQNGSLEFQGNPCDNYVNRQFSECSQNLNILRETCTRFYRVAVNNTNVPYLASNRTTQSYANNTLVQAQGFEHCVKYEDVPNDMFQNFLYNVTVFVKYVEQTFSPTGKPSGQPSGFPTSQPVLFLGNGTNSNSTDTGGNSTTSAPTGFLVFGPGNGTDSNSTTLVPTFQPVFIPVNNGTNSTNPGNGTDSIEVEQDYNDLYVLGAVLFTNTIRYFL